MYKIDDYIETAKEGESFGINGYKYRVWDKQKTGITHHSNSLDDARKWSENCIRYWLDQDSLS